MEQYNSIDSGLGAIELEQANPNEEGLAAEVATINDSALDLHFVPPSPPVSRSFNPGPDSTASPIHRFRAYLFVWLVLYPMFVLVIFLDGMWDMGAHWKLCWFPYYFLNLNAALQCSLMLCIYWRHLVTLIIVLKLKLLDCQVNGPPIQMPLVYPGMLLILYIVAFIAFCEQIYMKPDSIINLCKLLSTPNSSVTTSTTSTDSIVMDLLSSTNINIFTTTNDSVSSTPLIFPSLSVRARFELRFCIAVRATCALLFASHLVADMCATWTRHWNRRPRLHTLRRKISRLERVCCCKVRPACVNIAAPFWWILCLFALALYAKRYSRLRRPRRRRLRAQLLEMLQQVYPMLHLNLQQAAHR